MCNMEYQVMTGLVSFPDQQSRGDMYTQKATSPQIVYLRPTIYKYEYGYESFLGHATAKKKMQLF